MNDHTHRLIVDRFESEMAVVEVDGGPFLDLPRWLLPPGARPDDVILATPRDAADGAVAWELRIDAEATAHAREEARRLVDRLRRKDAGGDLSL